MVRDRASAIPSRVGKGWGSNSRAIVQFKNAQFKTVRLGEVNRLKTPRRAEFAANRLKRNQSRVPRRTTAVKITGKSDTLVRRQFTFLPPK
jgi:hypothetical protein